MSTSALGRSAAARPGPFLTPWLPQSGCEANRPLRVPDRARVSASARTSLRRSSGSRGLRIRRAARCAARAGVRFRRSDTRYTAHRLPHGDRPSGHIAGSSQRVCPATSIPRPCAASAARRRRRAMCARFETRHERSAIRGVVAGEVAQVGGGLSGFELDRHGSRRCADAELRGTAARRPRPEEFWGAKRIAASARRCARHSDLEGTILPSRTPVGPQHTAPAGFSITADCDPGTMSATASAPCPGCRAFRTPDKRRPADWIACRTHNACRAGSPSLGRQA